MAVNSNSRRALHAYVSDSAHDVWHDFGAEQGVSVSAILEALAPMLVAATEDPTKRDVTIVESLKEVVKDARRVDARRRRRR